jgi:hypothetical protein
MSSSTPKTDRELLELLKEFIPDLSQPTRELEQRLGIQDWNDFKKVVELPGKPLLPDQVRPLYFSCERQPGGGELAPRSLNVEYDPTPDARENHARALEHLTQLLGPATNGKAINALTSSWTIGRSLVDITSYTSNEAESNRLFREHPYLQSCTHLSIELQYLDQPPPAALLPIAAEQLLTIHLPRSATARDSWSPDDMRHVFELKAAENPKIPSAVLASVSPRTLIFGREEKSIAVFLPDILVQLPRFSDLQLGLSRIKPAKGPGGSHLAFLWKYGHCGLNLVNATGTNDLDSLAKKLASFLELPLEVNEQYNC